VKLQEPARRPGAVREPGVVDLSSPVCPSNCVYFVCHEVDSNTWAGCRTGGYCSSTPLAVWHGKLQGEVVVLPGPREPCLDDMDKRSEEGGNIWSPIIFTNYPDMF
jgi:hypothetical protein